MQSSEKLRDAGRFVVATPEMQLNTFSQWLGLNTRHGPETSTGAPRPERDNATHGPGKDQTSLDIDAKRSNGADAERIHSSGNMCASTGANTKGWRMLIT